MLNTHVAEALSYPATWIAFGAFVVTVWSVLWSRRGQTENLSLSQLVAANNALADRIGRVEVELRATHDALAECQNRETRSDIRDSQRLRRIIRLEDALMAAGVQLPDVQ